MFYVWDALAVYDQRHDVSFVSLLQLGSLKLGDALLGHLHAGSVGNGPRSLLVSAAGDNHSDDTASEVRLPQHTCPREARMPV